ncbi:hypothetical protein ACR769_07290 [Enterococcus gallinarum]
MKEVNFMWSIFSTTETILGFVGSIVSIGTFFLALRVKNQVTEIMDRVEFRDEYKRLSGMALGFLDIIESENIEIDSLKIQISDYTPSMMSKYTFFPRNIRATIKKIDSFDFYSIKGNVDNQIKIRKLFIELSTFLEKEAKL